MKEGRLHMRLDARLLRQAKRMAERQGVSLSALVTLQLRALVEADEISRVAKQAAPDAEQV
jgi:predicted HicB family RNase H-like nuclease